MAVNMKDINIVILHYNDKDCSLKAIESLIQDISGCPFDIQITVADNSEIKDDFKDLLRLKFPQVNYVDCGGNIGFGKGNNLGFKSASARYYCALNMDTLIPNNSKVIERIVKFMDNHPKIGCVGPKILSMDGTLQYSCYRFDLSSILIKPFKQLNLDNKYRWVRKYVDRLLMTDFNHNQTKPVEWVLGAAIVVRKEAIDQVGWFDERFYFYMEDCDWCHTMWENGWPVYYLHDIIIMHQHGRGSSRVPGAIKALLKNKLARIHLVSWFKYLWKWRGNHPYYVE